MTTVRPRRRLAAIGVLAAAVVLVTGTLAITHPWSPSPSCPAADHPDWSVARRWDEALLDAIRRALPNPPVHARNLFHTSVAMWDAWAAYDSTASGYIDKEKAHASDVPAARNEAISYAAYRVLTSRFIKAVGADQSLSEFDDVMDKLCYPIDAATTEGDSPAALGNRIAAAVLAYGLTDGSNQAGGYADPDYKPVNPPLVVAKPGTTTTFQPTDARYSVIFQLDLTGQDPVAAASQTGGWLHWGRIGSAHHDGESSRLDLPESIRARPRSSTSKQAELRTRP